MGDTLNFSDLFNNSVFDPETYTSVSYIDAIISLAISFGIGMFIYFVYRKTFRGVVYSYNYNVTFVLMTMITTLIIITISTNIVLSLGMVGALSIVRFRTAVKDPLDIVYMFWSISVGIAVGAKMYPVAVVGSLLIGIVLFWLSRKKLKEQSYLLIVRYTGQTASDEVRYLVRKLQYKLKSKTVRKEFTELTAEIQIRDDNTAFVHELSAVSGVVDVTLVNYNGDYAQ